MANRDSEEHQQVHEAITEAVRHIRHVSQDNGLTPNCYLQILLNEVLTMIIHAESPEDAMERVIVILLQDLGTAMQLRAGEERAAVRATNAALKKAMKSIKVSK